MLQIIKPNFCMNLKPIWRPKNSNLLWYKTTVFRVKTLTERHSSHNALHYSARSWWLCMHRAYRLHNLLFSFWNSKNFVICIFFSNTLNVTSWIISWQSNQPNLLAISLNSVKRTPIACANFAPLFQFQGNMYG